MYGVSLARPPPGYGRFNTEALHQELAGPSWGGSEVPSGNSGTRISSGRSSANQNDLATPGKTPTHPRPGQGHTRRVKNALIYHRNINLVNEFKEKDLYRHRVDGLSNLKFRVLDWETESAWEEEIVRAQSANNLWGDAGATLFDDDFLVFHHVKVKKGVSEYHPHEIPVVFVNEGWEVSLGGVMEALGKRRDRVPFRYDRLVEQFRQFVVEKAEKVPAGENPSSSLVGSNAEVDVFPHKIPVMIIVGVNLFGNLGTFIDSDQSLAKFYRTIRKYTSEEPALYVYADSSRARAMLFRESEKRAAARSPSTSSAIDHAEKFSPDTENAFLSQTQMPSALGMEELTERFKAELVAHFHAAGRLWDSPTAFEGCLSDIGVDLKGVAKYTLAHYLQVRLGKNEPMGRLVASEVLVELDKNDSVPSFEKWRSCFGKWDLALGIGVAMSPQLRWSCRTHVESRLQVWVMRLFLLPGRTKQTPHIPRKTMNRPRIIGLPFPEFSV